MMPFHRSFGVFSLTFVIGMLTLAPLSFAEAAWPFTPITKQKPTQPNHDKAAWCRDRIDSFVLARLDDQKLKPATPLSGGALLRRVAFDLTGLPPTPSEMERFLHDPSPNAYEKAVERYLASPRYGERWARHWLDVVRYADSDGFAIDGVRPTLWRYRDYVIRTFNEDRPFDQFFREQLAGDEIDAGTEGLVATGFYRLGPWEADNMVKEVKRQDYLDEVTSSVGAAFLGMTLGCARCHDHKYDPITAKDYYEMQAFFAPIEHNEVPAEHVDSERNAGFVSAKSRIDKDKADSAEKLKTHRVHLTRKLAAETGKEEKDVTDEDVDKAIGEDKPFSDEDKKKLKDLREAANQCATDAKPYATLAWTISNPTDGKAVEGKEEEEEEAKLIQTFLLTGGDVAAKGEKVSPDVLSATKSCTPFEKVTPEILAASNSGRRKALAEWITHPDNPLTARVLVNRLWQFHFGKGIVRTSNDFGRNGSGPTHPGLLDYLATRLIDSGWQLKALHREILMSATYRMSTHNRDGQMAAGIDPENRLLWRAEYRRLEAETVRDTLLAVSGRIRLTQGGPGFFEKLPDEMGFKFPLFQWHPSAEEERVRRSVYMFQRRNLVHPMMESFDVADASESCARRSHSLNPSQALELWNGEFARESSNHFAQRVRIEVRADLSEQVQRVFTLALNRPPNGQELKSSLEFLQQDAAEGAESTLSDLCLIVLNMNEFIYLN
jgi:hypothetical protein